MSYVSAWAHSGCLINVSHYRWPDILWAHVLCRNIIFPWGILWGDEMSSHTESYWPCVWDTQDSHFRPPQLEKGPKRKWDQRGALGANKWGRQRRKRTEALRGSCGENHEKRWGGRMSPSAGQRAQSWTWAELKHPVTWSFTWSLKGTQGLGTGDVALGTAIPLPVWYWLWHL